MVVAKDIKDIPWRQRHGPILRSIIFQFWSCVNAASLAATFLQLEPHDLPFREMAYTVLCLAAGGKNIHFLPCQNVCYNDAFGFISEGQEDSDEGQEDSDVSECAVENDRQHLWCIRHMDLAMGTMGYKYPMANKESYLTNKQTHGIS